MTIAEQYKKEFEAIPAERSDDETEIYQGQINALHDRMGAEAIYVWENDNSITYAFLDISELSINEEAPYCTTSNEIKDLCAKFGNALVAYDETKNFRAVEYAADQLKEKVIERGMDWEDVLLTLKDKPTIH